MVAPPCEDIKEKEQPGPGMKERGAGKTTGLSIKRETKLVINNHNPDPPVCIALYREGPDSQELISI